MARLPAPGGDTGNWGVILNDFLVQTHNADGTLKDTGVVATKAADTSVVHNSGNESVGGIKTFSASPVVPTPTASTHAATKGYVDSAASAGAPDATSANKGVVQLAGDLSGTAASPSVVKVNGIAITGAPISGQSIVATSNTAASWQAPPSAPVSSVSGKTGAVTLVEADITSLTSDLAATEKTANKGQPNGYAPLDGTGKVPNSNLPVTGSTPDATTTSKGTVQLAGDLGGTAASPTVPGLGTHISSISAHAASAIIFTSAGTIAATNVQTAIEEVASEAYGAPIPSSTKAGLPASGTAGRLRRVTDDVRGIWMDNGSAWVSILGQVANAREFGAIGDGTTDDTVALQAWINAVAAGGGSGYLPSGTYLISSTIGTSPSQTEVHLFGPQQGWNSGRAATIKCATDTIAMRLDGGNSLIEHILFDGRNTAGNNAGGIGLVIGPNHKITVRNVTTRFFREAGFVANGTQNSSFYDLDSQFNKINLWITNDCRTCMLINPNTSDYGIAFSTLNPYMDGIAPNVVELWIGRRANSYITMKTLPQEVPSNLTILHGIFERHERNDYNVRISHGWGYVRLIDLELQGAKTALIRIDPGVNSYATPLRLFLDNLEPQNTDGTGSIPTISNANGDLGLEIISTITPSFSGANRWHETRYKENINSEDYGIFQSVLDAPPTFAHSIGSWTTSGGAGAASYVATTRKLKITVDSSGFGANCNMRPIWLSASLGGFFIYTANLFIKVKYHCTNLSGLTSIKVQAVVAGPTFRRTIGTITSVGEGEFLYACQGDELGGVLIDGFLGSGGAGTADFAYFAATVY